MADLSDDLAKVDGMYRLIVEERYDLVCGSRYMRGGRQLGGPPFKGFLSRLAGVSLHALAGLPTRDATNAFRMYRASLLRSIPIESSGGFELSLELTVKAHTSGLQDHRGPLDVARPDRRRVTVSTTKVVTQVSLLVSPRIS